MDLHSKKNYKTTKRGGRSWRDVACRVTDDAWSGDIINMEDAMNTNRDEEHKLVEGGPRDLVSVLLLKSVNGQDYHLGAYDAQEDKR